MIISKYSKSVPELPHVRHGPLVQSNLSVVAKQNERTKPVHLLRPCPHDGLQRKQCDLCSDPGGRDHRWAKDSWARSDQHIRTNPDPYLPDRNLAQGSGIIVGILKQTFVLFTPTFSTTKH